MPVNEYGKGRFCVERLFCCLVCGVGLFYLAFCGYNGEPFGYKEVNNVYGFVEEAATVATKVDYKGLGSFVL